MRVNSILVILLIASLFTSGMATIFGRIKPRALHDNEDHHPDKRDRKDIHKLDSSRAPPSDGTHPRDSNGNDGFGRKSRGDKVEKSHSSMD